MIALLSLAGGLITAGVIIGYVIGRHDRKAEGIDLSGLRDYGLHTVMYCNGKMVAITEDGAAVNLLKKYYYDCEQEAVTCPLPTKGGMTWQV